MHTVYCYASSFNSLKNDPNSAFKIYIFVFVNSWDDVYFIRQWFLFAFRKEKLFTVQQFYDDISDFGRSKNVWVCQLYGIFKYPAVCDVKRKSTDNFFRHESASRSNPNATIFWKNRTIKLCQWIVLYVFRNPLCMFDEPLPNRTTTAGTCPHNVRPTATVRSCRDGSMHWASTMNESDEPNIVGHSAIVWPYVRCIAIGAMSVCVC